MNANTRAAEGADIGPGIGVAAATPARDSGSIIIVLAIVFIVVAIGMPVLVDWLRQPDAAQLAQAQGAVERAAQRFKTWQGDEPGAPAASPLNGQTSAILFIEEPLSPQQFVARGSAARVWAKAPDGQVFTVDYYYDGNDRPLRAGGAPTLQTIGYLIEAAMRRNDLRALQDAGLRMGPG